VRERRRNEEGGKEKEGRRKRRDLLNQYKSITEARETAREAPPFNAHPLNPSKLGKFPLIPLLNVPPLVSFTNVQIRKKERKEKKRKEKKRKEKKRKEKKRKEKKRKEKWGPSLG